MNATDQQKVLNAGFTIIRDEVLHKGGSKYQGKIKAKTKVRREWFTLEKDFKTRSALISRMNELLQDPFVVKD